ATTVKPTSPHTDATPIKTAPVAPAKPIWDSAWPANVCPRSTRKYPTNPDTTAATPAAAKAFRMKSYSSMVMMAVRVAMVMVMAVVVRMIGAFDVAAARQDENVAVGM